MIPRVHRLSEMLEPLGAARRGGIVGGAGPQGEDLLFLEPERWFEPTSRTQAAEAIREAEELRRSRILAGWLAYELGSSQSPGSRDRRSAGPLLELGAYRSPAAWKAGGSCSVTPFQLSDFRLDLSRDEYLERIERILGEIAAGNVYQVNLSLRLHFRFQGDPRALFLSLFRSQPARYVSLFRNGRRWILSFSPELFLRWEGDNVLMKPMKGTAPRGRFRREDEERSAWLRSDGKSLAENLMIVDLVRNDLGRLARFGSVQVLERFETELLPTVIQMTSTVGAALRSGSTLADLLDATFPCGSVTGAPKLSAMRLISELESGPRGVYCGALGCVGTDWGQWSVGIRTLVLEPADGTDAAIGSDPSGDYVGVLGIGSGIVADSDPIEEWEECRLKAHFVTSPRPQFQLLESLRWEGRAVRLEAHLDRMAESASYFGFPFDRESIRRAILEAGRRRCRNGSHKLRVLLDPQGECSIEHCGLEELSEPVRIALASEITDSRDSFLFHKTTQRGRYERAQAAARARGFWDLLFRNERGEVTEGSISNVFIRMGQEWRTPPLESGLLPGVMRERIIGERNAVEKAFDVDELRRADEILLTNSVRGVVQACWIDQVVLLGR